MNRVEPKAATREEDHPASETPVGHVIIYMCPTPGCGNYYASTNFQPSDPTLYNMQYRREEGGERTPLHTRADCPDCWLRDHKRVERVPYIISEFIRYDRMLEAIQKTVARKIDTKER